ncbi:MAG: hypothetical protein Q4D58_03770 [Synergistaceae bacterium]|nr:hypothetical protein [Synergistaceae bacterium]
MKIVILDSEGCAPCQYMVEAVTNVAGKYGDKLTCKESLIKILPVLAGRRSPAFLHN